MAYPWNEAQTSTSIALTCFLRLTHNSHLLLDLTTNSLSSGLLSCTHDGIVRTAAASHFPNRRSSPPVVYKPGDFSVSHEQPTKTYGRKRHRTWRHAKTACLHLLWTHHDSWPRHLCRDQDCTGFTEEIVCPKAQDLASSNAAVYKSWSF